MEESILLKLSDIHKNFYPESGAVQVLKGLNLMVRKGQTAAIIGPSGSGKSTLLHLIGALDKPDSGQILFNDRDIAGFSAREMVLFRMRHLGMVFQKHHLLPQCTALENIILPTLPLQTPVDEALERANQLLHATGLTDRANHFPSQLSGGECQRVAVARALINDPQLLLADEPTGALDRQSAIKIMEILTDFAAIGKTIIIVTHAEFVADKMKQQFELKDGGLVNG